MQGLRATSFLLAISCAGLVRGADASGRPTPPIAPAPAIDKAKIEQYIRFAEAFSPSVKIAVDDPAPTALNGFYRLIVHLSVAQSKQDKTYYLTADGQHVLTGPVWDLAASPFAETASRIPEDGPSFGPATARIPIVIFSDFQCPYCREFARTVRENIPRKYPTDVRVIFKDFPITGIHPWAEAAAEAGHCVGDDKPDVFWSFHDWIFDHQGDVNGGNLRQKTLDFSKDHGLDPSKVATCIDSHAARAKVEASLAQGRKLNVEQTPTFFLGGRPVSGAVSWASLDTLIQMELNRPSFIPAAVRPSAGGPEARSGQ